MHDMGKLAGAEELRAELKGQLQRAMSLDTTNPALIMIRPEDRTLVDKLGEVMLGLDMGDVDFGTENCPQFIDYVAKYNEAIAIILEKGGIYGADVLEKIKKNIATKATERLGINVSVVGTSCYKEGKSVDAMLAEAYKL